MKRLLVLALATAAAVPAVSLLVGAKPAKTQHAERIARGKYLVSFGGCNDCHTPLKMTPSGPAPDMTRLLSGHPEGTQLPPPNLAPGPWFAATAGMTAWTGPWGITYSANLTPDTNTGLGIWTEEMFIKAMRTGRHMGSGRPILPPMPWQGVAVLNDDDLKAVFAYLRDIPAIANHVPDPQPPAGQARLE
jgi:cytochrome c553